MATKVLVVGPVQGHIEKAFQKITKLHAKTSFDFALVVGDLFDQQLPDDQLQGLISGTISLPLPVYFTTGDFGLPQSVQERLDSTGELCHNLIYLGRKGTLTTTTGVKIVFLGGREVQNENSLTQSIGRYDPLYLENEARVLQGAHSAHILLTSQWPAGIENGSTVQLPNDTDITQSSTAITNLCATLKPRYHFSPSKSTEWKREPFLWPMDYADNSTTQITRFESVGSVLRKSSEWISAFTIDPSKPAVVEGAQRAAPFSVVNTRNKRKREPAQTDPYRNGRFDNNADNPHLRRSRGSKHQKFDPSDCFMCMGRDTFSSEMLVSIGDDSFATSLRGPLPTNETFPQLTSTGNLMIIPMYHAADETSHGQRTRSERVSEFSEMTRYRHALQHMLLFRAKGELGAVCWEVNRTGIRHFHWQWIACPQEMIRKGLVEAAFKIAAENNAHSAFHSCSPDQLLEARQSDFFRVWIWSADKDAATSKNGLSTQVSPVEQADALSSGTEARATVPTHTKESSIYFELAQDERFNIQFGRKVMSSLLKLEHRADWKTVPADEGDEARDADAWKADFSEFDFAMAVDEA